MSFAHGGLSVASLGGDNRVNQSSVFPTPVSRCLCCPVMCCLSSRAFFFFFLFSLFDFVFSFLADLWHRKSPGQGSEPNLTFHLRRSCSNAGSLTHCAGLGIKPASWHCRDTSNPITPQRELLGGQFKSSLQPQPGKQIRVGAKWGEAV